MPRTCAVLTRFEVYAESPFHFLATAAMESVNRTRAFLRLCRFLSRRPPPPSPTTRPAQKHLD